MYRSGTARIGAGFNPGIPDPAPRGSALHGSAACGFPAV